MGILFLKRENHSSPDTEFTYRFLFTYPFITIRSHIPNSVIMSEHRCDHPGGYRVVLTSCNAQEICCFVPVTFP